MISANKIVYTLAMLAIAISQFACSTPPQVGKPSDGLAPTHIYLLMGQSNMVGRGELRTLTPNPSVLMLVEDGQWVIATDPLHTIDPRAKVSPGITFGLSMLKVHGPDCKIGLVPCAVGGTPLERWQRGGDLYTAAVGRAKKAMASGRLAGVIWLQGESDSAREDLASTYAERLDQMIHDLREDLEAPGLPFVAGQLNPALVEREKTKYAPLVMQAIEDLPKRVPHTAVASSIGLEHTGDLTHFTSEGLREMGYRYAQSMSQLLPWTENQLALDLLNPSGEYRLRYQKAAAEGVIEIAPVNLPINAPGDCNHYGWPIATPVGDSLVVMHRRIPGHNPEKAGQPNEAMSYGIVTRSDDGGRTWSHPYDLRDSMLPEDRTRGGIVPLSHRSKFDPTNDSKLGYKVHLHTIGTTRDGGVVAINNHGVFRSDDLGKTWKHFSKALRDDTFEGNGVSFGPRIIDDPVLGLLAFATRMARSSDASVVDHKGATAQFALLQSSDDGAEWQATDMPMPLPFYEHAAIKHGNRYLMLSRNQKRDTNNFVNQHFAATWQPGSPPTFIPTNLKDYRYIDTVDLSYNPVTKRIEAVRSNRDSMELWLWSIDPEQWDTGIWRRESLLFDGDGPFYFPRDGFHPAAAVIDAEAGVQHIFIYSGKSSGPTGIFRITRSLETLKLNEGLSLWER